MHIDTAPRIDAREWAIGAAEWLGKPLDVHWHVLGYPGRAKRFKCPVCNHPNRAVLYALPDPCCVRCAQARGFMYSYQVKSPVRRRAATAKDLAGKLEALGQVAAIDLKRLKTLSGKAQNT